MIKIGGKNGRLEIVSKTDRSDKKHRWYLCRCECGTELEVSSKHLTPKGKKSCGCLKVEHGIVKLPEGEAAFNALYLSYDHNARRRGISFDLSKEQFRSLTQQDCYYCGTSPGTVYWRKGHNGGFRYNGIDRSKTKIGYNESNCVPCCDICNRMKMALDQDVFLAQIDRIHNHQKGG